MLDTEFKTYHVDVSYVTRITVRVLASSRSKARALAEDGMGDVIKEVQGDLEVDHDAAAIREVA